MTGAAAHGGSRMRQLAGHTVVYGLSGVAAKFVGILLLPLYASYLTLAEFGQIELVIVSATVAGIVLRMGLLAALFRFSFDYATPEARHKTVQTVFGSILIVSTAGLAVGLAAVNPISDLLQVDRELVVIGLFGLWVSMNLDVVTAIYRIEQRPNPYVAFALINLAITVALTLVLVIVFELGPAGVLLGNFGGSYVVYVLILVARRHTIGFGGFDRELLRTMLRFSVPLMPAGVALWGLNFADRFQVMRLASPDDLGIYSAASKIALGIMVLISAFQTAWVPFANAIPDDEDARRTYRLAFSYWSVWTLWGLVAISVAAPPYIQLSMPRAWWPAADIVPLLMAGLVLWGAYMIINIGVNRSKRTRLTPVVTSVAATVNIGLNFVLIPKWGVFGAGLSTVIGYALLVLLGWLNAQTGFPVPYDWSRVARIWLAAGGLVALSVWVVPDTGWVGILARIGLVAAFPLALFAFGAVSVRDLARFEGLFARVRQGRRRRPVEEGLESTV